MLPGRVLSAAVLLVAMSLPCVAATRTRRGPTSHNNKSSRSTKPVVKRSSGQRSIDDSRATEIQTALGHSGYLTSDQASGHWDAQTEAAMQKFQADNGWQTKLIPDSRAIIKLGLGPSHNAQPAGTEAGSESPALTNTSYTVPAQTFASDR